MNRILLLILLTGLSHTGWGQSSQSYRSYDQQFANEKLTSTELKAYEARGIQKLSDYFFYLQKIAEMDSLPDVQNQYWEELKSLFIHPEVQVYDHIMRSPSALFDLGRRAAKMDSYKDPVHLESMGSKAADQNQSSPDQYRIVQQFRLVFPENDIVLLEVAFYLVHQDVQFDDETQKVWKIYLGEMSAINQ
ncbi:hypothetical protein KFE98_01270 [bacterium SCSIO 12741]|nr:hypothetical protein KFE98_01270 [bacterium SCSIO 12741]